MLLITIICMVAITGNITGLPTSCEIQIITNNYLLGLSLLEILQDYLQVRKYKLSLTIIC